MKRLTFCCSLSAVLSAGCAVAGVFGDTPDALHAWAVHDINRPKPAKVDPGAYFKADAPSDAVVLFDGTLESFTNNWCDMKGRLPEWKLDNDSDFYCVPDWTSSGGIRTRAEFGDCQLHIEFKHEKDKTCNIRDAGRRGNSGVFLMGRYEIQVLESYYTSRDLEGKPGYLDTYTDGQAGAIYAENPPMVNPQRKPGEWQTYDIVFHRPIWQGPKLVHPGTITVFFNGVLVQDHWELEGTTAHRSRHVPVPHKATGPITLQDHRSPVHYRNIWLRPLPSRWDNLTNGKMSAKEEEVMKLRRQTAERLFARIADPKAATAENVAALAEVISYANEGKYAAAFKACLAEYRQKTPKAKEDLKKVNGALDVLRRCKVIDDPAVSD